ncbi:MAG: cytochrome c oxidase assembly protein [Hyphomicrobiaceae bacterium]
MTDANHHQIKTMPHRDRKVAAICVSVVVGMVGLAYASVPLYRLFCQVTGYAGTTQRASAPAAEILDRTVVVRFDANTSPGLSWKFEALTAPQTVRIGETTTAMFRATNLGTGSTVGTSSFNVVPDQAGAFFNKLECFCFTEQALAPGQSIDMPVQYFIDPAIVKDSDGARIGHITLSYTFYPVAMPKKGVALKTGDQVQRQGG